MPIRFNLHFSIRQISKIPDYPAKYWTGGNPNSEALLSTVIQIYFTSNLCQGIQQTF